MRTSSFLSIIENKTIRLSSLSLSNDSAEGKLVTQIIVQLAKDDGIDDFYVHRLKQDLYISEYTFDGLGFCLSEEGDLLSQWRGYADNASGVSIGFSKDYLEKMANNSRNDETPGFTLSQVEYEYDKQIELLRPTYAKIKELIDKGAYTPPSQPTLLTGFSSAQELEEKNDRNENILEAFSDLSWKVITLLEYLYQLKTKGFQEEKEWRLISLLLKPPVMSDICQFHVLRDRIIPHREYKIDMNAIEEIIIGPKNVTPTHVVESILKQNGFTNTKVKRSDITYR